MKGQFMGDATIVVSSVLAAVAALVAAVATAVMARLNRRLVHATREYVELVAKTLVAVERQASASEQQLALLWRQWERQITPELFLRLRPYGSELHVEFHNVGACPIYLTAFQLWGNGLRLVWRPTMGEPVLPMRMYEIEVGKEATGKILEGQKKRLLDPTPDVETVSLRMATEASAEFYTFGGRRSVKQTRFPVKFEAGRFYLDPGPEPEF